MIDKTLSYIREAVIGVVPLTDAVKASINDRRPLDVQSFRRIVRGHFIGEVSSLPAAGQIHPYLRWESSLRTLSEDQNGNLQAEFNEQMTIVCGEGVVFRGEAFELRGRFKEGQEQVQIQSREGESEQQVVHRVETAEESPD